MLGGGTAGTMIANKLRRRLDRHEWEITVVDRDDDHHYQPGYLFVPVRRLRPPTQVVRQRHALPRRRRRLRARRDRPGRRPTTTPSLLDGRPDAAATTTWSSPPAPRRARTRRPGMLGPRVAAQHLRLLHPRRGRGAGGGAAALRPRPARRAHHRDADQVPGRAAGVHLPRRGVAARARPPRPGRAGLRDPAGRARSPSRSPRRTSGGMLDERKIHVETDFMVERIDPEREGAGVLRRARGALRPAGDGPAEHGRRLRRPLRARRRAQLRAGRQAHPAVDGARQHLRDRRRQRHPRLQGRLGGALLGRDLRRQLPRSTSPASR